MKRKPNSRDALLGLGAISTLAGEVDQAKQYYLRVLNLNPRDAIAQAALIGFYADADSGPGESQLKALIDAEPGAGYLRFSLGNVYARQARWPQAQEAYFRALRSDANNPDYAYNLAVSLDQLGQTKVALQYYENALALSDDRPGNFARDAALARIRAIGHP